jgi:calcineurin-like phosphoesterase
VVIVDIHAEATSEKRALGWFLDGKVSAVIGTHTHIPTADEEILPQGTAYITDAGMTGAFDSVIGIDKAEVIKKFTTQLPAKFSPGRRDVRLCGVLIEVDAVSGKGRSIERIMLKE